MKLTARRFGLGRVFLKGTRIIFMPGRKKVSGTDPAIDSRRHLVAQLLVADTFSSRDSSSHFGSTAVTPPPEFGPTSVNLYPTACGLLY
jgi:hypothetical protein